MQDFSDALGDRLPDPIGRELRAAVAEIVELTDVLVETAAWDAAHPSAAPSSLSDPVSTVDS